MDEERIRIEEIVEALQKCFVISINPEALKKYNNGRPD